MIIINKKDVFSIIESKAEKFSTLSDKIWDCAETAFQEFCSAKILCEALIEEKFRVEENVAGIHTAFKGIYGCGKPVIGILGEYDALSGISQEACIAEKKRIQSRDSGHGCGHNMLGVGSLAAAVGIKEYLKDTGISGTVVYFGCPGEEGGSGKAFMAREGVFDILNVALTWHPADVNMIYPGSTLANYQVTYKFFGISTHAGRSPHLGRSALDSVELMNVGVNYLREHVIPEARIHYAITNAGGYSPNVVQPYAEVLYLIRAPKVQQVHDIYERINKIAQGAALMTETRVEIDFMKACSNFNQNTIIAELLHKNMNYVELPIYVNEEIRYANEIKKSIGDNEYDSLEKMVKNFDDEIKKTVLAQKGNPFYNFVAPFNSNGELLFGSTDVGDVSWVCPTSQFYGVTWAAGTPGHSWQVVAQGRCSSAHKGLLYAGKVIAGTAIDLLENPELVTRAQEELEERLEGSKYRCPIPEGVKPRAFRCTK